MTLTASSGRGHGGTKLDSHSYRMMLTIISMKLLSDLIRPLQVNVLCVQVVVAWANVNEAW